MPLARRLAILSTVCVCTAGGAARAQSTSLHGTGSFTAAYTDNMLGTASEPGPGEQPPVSVVFFELSPGLLLYHGSPRVIHELTYSHPFTIFVNHSEANAQSDIGAWRAIFALTPRDELTTGLSVSRSTTRLAALNAPTGQAANDAVLLGDNTLLYFDAYQTYTRQLTDDWQLLQSSGAGYVYPLDTPGPQPNRWLARLGLGTEYTKGNSAYALLGESTYFVNTAVNEGNVDIPREDQLLVSARARWRHDLSARWSSELNAGVAGAVDASAPSNGIFGPVGLGAIRYNFDGYGAELVAERVIAPNLITSQMYLSDQARLVGGLPLWREASILLQTSVGYTHNRIINVRESTYAATFDMWLFDTGIGWFPEDGPQVVARYQHTEQIGNESDAQPAATFHRNMVLLTVGMVWPSRAAMPRVPAGPPVRVDGSDRDPLAPGNQTGDAAATPAPAGRAPGGR